MEMDDGFAREGGDYDSIFLQERAAEAPDEPAADPLDRFFAFPKGAKAGSCLHEIFEFLDFQAAGEAGALIADKLAKYGFDEQWTPVVKAMLLEVTAAPLGDGGPRLMDIGRAARMDEMEFYYTVPGVSDGELNRIFAEAIDGGEITMGAEEPPVGLLKGFIDLVFEYHGRFYIVDYKSNYLGHRLEDYDADRLPAVMARAGYGLQYHIYTVALHRYLGQRLPGYDYDACFGGVFYLFLRGIRARGRGGRGVFFDRPPRQRITALDRVLQQLG